MESPCFDVKTKTDCPNRRAGCAVSCKKWATYVRERDESYKQKQIDSEADKAVYDARYKRMIIAQKRNIRYGRNTNKRFRDRDI